MCPQLQLALLLVYKSGEIEAEIAKCGTKEKKILTDKKPGLAYLPKENPFGISSNSTITLSEDDLDYYYNKFEQKGFIGGLNYNRALDLYVFQQYYYTASLAIRR